MNLLRQYYVNTPATHLHRAFQLRFRHWCQSVQLILVVPIVSRINCRPLNFANLKTMSRCESCKMYGHWASDHFLYGSLPPTVNVCRLENKMSSSIMRAGPALILNPYCKIWPSFPNSFGVLLPYFDEILTQDSVFWRGVPFLKNLDYGI